ncbi:MAG TPA: MAPEG family protein [Kofleriaceae bacterium]|nr:MAPEG family protein [Kofleriaceae bacterium]
MTLHAIVLATAVLTWLMVMTASMLRSRGDLALAMGNRDAMPPASPLAERADRAAKNMLENLVLFGVVVLAAGDHNPGRALLGAEIFLAARILYWPIYLAGIPVVRTLAYAVSMVGLVMIGTSLL